MEVVVPAAPSMDFDFKANGLSPYLSAPSSPRRFGECFFTSAPTSPTRMSEFYREFDRFSQTDSSLAVPFNCEEKPGTPKSPKGSTKADIDDFAFDFSEDLEKASLSAEELFDGGKIRPLKPPPRLQIGEFASPKSPLLSPRSPKSPISKGARIIRNVFSPRRKKEHDPFAASMESENQRGRERVQALSKNSSRRATRSLSPLRVSEYPWEEEEKQSKQTPKQSKPSFSSSSKSSSKKWRIKDFLLFRSASEGHATDKDPFRKYSSLFRKTEEAKNASFRSTDSFGGSVSASRRKVSAHELHYTTNKAVSENMKKKTFLPYKQGILGRLAFNPAVHALSNGFGSLAR
ncbi:hypothetical protein SLE2022_214740 [Rubroshorea leprosula]